MEIIRGQLSPMYIQHEAIEAQKLMVNSPNHTVVYIPSGPMGVPITGTFNATAPQGPATAPKEDSSDAQRHATLYPRPAPRRWRGLRRAEPDPKERPPVWRDWLQHVACK